MDYWECANCCRCCSRSLAKKALQARRFVTSSLVSWVTVARLVRGEVLAVKQKEFVEAARAIGASSVSVILRHIVPNTLGPIIVVAAYIVPGAIIAEAILSYLGIGIRPTVRLDAPFPTSWGSMILEGSKAWESQPWMLIAPTLAIASVTLAFTFIGDGLRDAFDPRQAER
ncbi:MAG: ABC transporter permease [Thermomicrobium sp.]